MFLSSFFRFFRAIIFFAFLATGLLKGQNLTISTTGETGTSGNNWSISGNVLTITGNADVNASVISSHLSSNNLSLSGVVNVYVNAAITWSSNSILTLNALQNVLIYRDITASGSSPQLNIYFGGSNATTAPNNSFQYALSQRNRNKISFSSASAVFRVGNESYTVCTNLSQLTQAMSNATGSTRVALGASISLSQTYTNSLFPINFSGKFDGLGQVIDGLRIRNSGGASVKANLGLFSQLQGATVRNLGITNVDILTNSTAAGTSGSEFRIGALAGNIGNSSLTAGYSATAYTTIIESVWSNGNIGTANNFSTDDQSTGDRQKFFFAGGLVGSINNGTANISRCYSYCNVSSSGSYTDNLSAGGLIGDVGINVNLVGHTTSTNSSILFNLSKSFSTGSILTGGQGFYYGTGGLIGVVFVSGSTIEDCYSWSSAVAFAGGGSMGGILGFGIDGGTYRNMYSTQSNQGDVRTTKSNLYYSQSPSSGTTLPSGFSNTVWSKANGELPILLDLESPPTILYVRVTSGQSSNCGNVSINYTITDAAGTAVTLSSLGLGSPTGTPVFTINNLTPPGSYNGVSYLSGLTLTGANANSYTLNPFPSNASSHTITGTCTNYQISFDGNTNTSGTAPANIAFSSSTTIPDQGSLVKTGSTFLGWNTAANGSGTSYAGGSTYSGASSLTLFAQWVSLPSLGCVTIVASGGAAENSGWVASYNTIRPNSSTAVSINASDIVSKLGIGNVKIMGNCITVSSAISYTTNTKSLELEANATIIQNDAITLSGPLSMTGGGNITINGNINTSTGNANGDILFESAGDISISSSRSITTNGGDVIMWANSDGNATSSATDGSIVINHSSSISTSGGHLWMGGGSGSSSWNGLTVGNGYAVAGSLVSVGAGSNFTSGVCIMRSTINTNGGDIFIGGQNNKTGFSASLANYGTTTIDAGNGRVKIEARSTTTTNNDGTFATGMHSGLGGVSAANLTIRSSHNNSANNAIELEVANVTKSGLVVEGNTLFQSTGAGKISIICTSTGSGAGIDIGYLGTNSSGYLDVLSSTGDITLNTASSGITIYSGQNSTLGFKAGSSVTSSTANIRIISNLINTVGILNNNTTGTLRIEPVAGSSFSSALNTTQIRYSSGITGLIIGHTTNTSNITIGSATSINGPIEVYGGTISLSGSLTTTNTSTGNIVVSCTSISGNGNISIADGRTATLSIVNSAEYNGVISGTGSNFIKNGAGNLTLTGANSYAGTTTINQGNIQIGNGGTTGAIGTGNITNNTSLIYNRSNDYTIPGIISGSGSLTKQGSGTLTLTQNNTYSGSNTISAGVLVLQNDAPNPSNRVFNGTGQLRIEPSGSSFSSSFSNTGWTFASTLSGLTLGKSSNTTDISVDNTTNIAGPISILGGNISVNENLNTTASANGSVLLRAAANILVAANKSILTNSSSITFWADADNNNLGGIRIDDNVTVDSRTNTDRSNNTHTTGGGRIAFAGGLDDGGSASGTGSITTGLSANDGFPDGYAVNSGSAATQTGIILGTSSSATGHNCNVSIFSGGGPINFHGLATNNSSNLSNGPTGLMFFEGYNINSGSNGNITLIGNSNLTSGGWAIAMDLAAWRALNGSYTANGIVRSVNGNINIIGRAAGGSSGNIAIAIDGETNRHVLAATGSGNVSFDGLASGTSPLDIRLTNVDALSASGAITLTARGTSGVHLGGYAIGDGLYLGQKTGSLVTSSSSNISIVADNIQLTRPLNTNSTGALVFESSSNSFNSGISLSNQTFASTHTSLRVGKTTNTASVTIGSSTISIAGPISVYGDNININQNLTTTSGGTTGDILLKAVSNITLAASRSITTNGGDALFWADSDNNGNGYILLNDNCIVNTANGSTTSGLSGGGNIVLAGGPDDGSNDGTASDGIPDGYAASTSFNGVKLSTTSTGHTQFYSGGGNIIVKGRSTLTGGTDIDRIGLYHYGLWTANSGKGAIILEGVSSGFYGLNFVHTTNNVTTGSKHLVLISDKTSGDAVKINGTSSNSHGVVFNYLNPKEILATGGGNISITGNAGALQGVFMQNQDVLATSGTITIDGGTLGIRTTNYGARFGAKAGSAITSSSSDITISGNVLTIDALASTFVTHVNTTGTLTVQPSGTSFTSAINWPISNLTLSGTISGLTIGKTTNTANITLGGTTTIAGPISIFGGTIALNENVSSSNGSTISLYGNGLTFGSGITVTSSGQLVVAPQTASNTIGLGGATGTLSLPASYFSTNFSDGFSNIQIGSNAQTGAIAANTFTLRDNMTFLTSGSLTLGGRPALGSNNVTLGAGITTINVGSPANYFQTNGTGTIIRNIASGTNRLFPVGNSAYNPVTITNNTGAADDFSLRVLDEVYRDGATGTVFNQPRVKRTWLIDKTAANAGSGINFVFNWNSGESTANLNSPRLYHYDGTEWDKQTGSTSSTSNSLTYTGYTGTFSPFAIGDDVVMLPVSWLNFGCQKNNDAQVSLNWSTASEENSKRFIIERSLNGQAFEPIGEVPAAGFSHSIRQYSFTDANPLKTAAYYRVAMEEFNGHRVYTSICMSNAIAAEENSPVKVYPNPSNGVVNIHASEGGTYSITDMAGRILRSGTLQANTRIEGLPQGIYCLTVQSGDVRYTQKLVVE